MREKSKYFRINRQEEFQRGFWEEKLYWENGVTLPLDSSARLISRLFDSQEKETAWYRFSSQGVFPNNTSCRLTVFSSETDVIFTPQGEVSIADCIASSLPWKEKQRYFAPFQMMQLPLEEELLLYGVKGRYLWFSLELASSQEEAPIIQQICLSFGGQSWLKDLPEIFQTQDQGFLQRYLAIFQTMYEKMEHAIETTVQNYTPQQAPPEFLQWLASWYCIREKKLWSQEQLRVLLAHARELYEAMGTRWVMEFLCRLYLGEPVQIVEYPQKDDPDFSCPPGVSREQIFQNPYVFTVLVPARLIENQNRYLSLLRIVDSCKPAYLQAKVILLSQQARSAGYRLGQDTYLSEGTSDISNSGGIILQGPERREEM